MVSVPHPSIRSISECRNDTSLTLVSGMARPERANTPLRMTTRRLVNTYRVVIHFKNGHTDHRASTRSDTATIPHRTGARTDPSGTKKARYDATPTTIGTSRAGTI